MDERPAGGVDVPPTPPPRRTPLTASKYMRAFIHRKTLNETSTFHLEGAIKALCTPKTEKQHASDEPAEIEPGQYRTVIIDPPWPYGTALAYPCRFGRIKGGNPALLAQNPTHSRLKETSRGGRYRQRAKMIVTPSATKTGRSCSAR